MQPGEILNFLVSKENASEENPLKLGNVEFWHPVAGVPDGLCYSIPTSQWDSEKVQEDLNKVAEKHWGELAEHIKN